MLGGKFINEILEGWRLISKMRRYRKLLIKRRNSIYNRKINHSGYGIPKSDWIKNPPPPHIGLREGKTKGNIKINKGYRKQGAPPAPRRIHANVPPPPRPTIEKKPLIEYFSNYGRVNFHTLDSNKTTLIEIKLEVKNGHEVFNVLTFVNTDNNERYKHNLSDFTLYKTEYSKKEFKEFLENIIKIQWGI